MNANLDKIAKDLYGKIQVRFPDIEFGDEEGNVLSKKEDIPNARFFEFEYSENGEALGTIAITLDEDDGIVIQISGDLVDDDNSMHGGAYQFIRSFRKFAKTRLLNFDIQNIGKSELDKRDYEFQAKRKEENIMESKMYGTSKISYQDLGEARLVVKHSQPINLDLPAGRTMHIEGIYIENANGERFRYPAKHLNGARALAEHIKHGGNPYDPIGKHICGLSEELASLRKFKGFVSRQEQISEAMGNVTGRVIERIEQIKETIHKLQRSAYYESFVESFEAQEEQMIPEAIVDDLVNRLTVRTFNEELKSVFPYIYKFIDESEIDVVEVSPDDLLDEVFGKDGDKEEGTTHKGGKVEKTKHGIKHQSGPGTYGGYKANTHPDDPEEITPGPRGRKVGPAPWHNESVDPEDQFESFMDDIYHEGMSDAVGKDLLFSKDKGIQTKAIADFNDQVLSQELPAGSQGQTAIDTLMGFIDDAQFLDSLRDQDANLDVRSMVQDYVQERDPHVAVQLHFGEEGADAEEAPPAPAPEAPPAPAPEAPPAPAPEAPPEAAAPAAPAAPMPAPVAESEEDPPFDGPYTKHKGDVKDKSGAVHTGHSQAKHLAHQGIKSAIAKAKKAGAKLDTKIDFGHKEMTLHDAIEECGMTVEEAGFEQPMEMGLPAMLRYVSGFYNKDEGNFPLGGMRVKIKVKKAAEDGEFGEFDPAELMKVIKFIDMKDPSGDEQHNVLRLAGVQQPEREMDEAGGMPDFDGIMQGIQGQLANIQKDPNTKFTQSNTSSGTIDGKPATYNDAMAKANQMQFKMPKFGDDDTDDAPFDFNNPDDIGQRMQKKIGGAFSKMQGQIPNQNVQFPGGQMNPADMMKQIMQKINFGK